MTDLELIPPIGTPTKMDPIVGFEKKYNPPIIPSLGSVLPDTSAYKSTTTFAEPEMLASSKPAQWEKYFPPDDEMLKLFKKTLAEPGDTAMKELAELTNTPSFRLALEIGKHDDPKISKWKESYDEFCEKALNSLKSFPATKR